MNAENKITFQAFTERVAKRAKVSEAEADAYIHQFASTAGHALENGDEVQLYHFGRFRTSHVDEHPGHNPGTGEAVTVPEHTRVDFHPYKALLLAVNWPFRHLRTRMLAEEKTSRRPSALGWLLLALVLVALILVGIYAVRMLNPGSVTAAPAPAEAPASTEPAQPAVQSTPVVTETATDSAPATAADTTTPAPVEPVAATSIVVVAGDTLWGISQSQWQDTSWWPLLYAENRASFPGRNPDLIEPGRSLRIPVLAGSTEQPTDADLRLKMSAYRVVADDYARLGHARAAEYRQFVNRGSGAP